MQDRRQELWCVKKADAYDKINVLLTDAVAQIKDLNTGLVKSAGRVSAHVYAK